MKLPKLLEQAFIQKELLFSIKTDVYDSIQIPINPLNTYLYNLYK